MTHCLRAFPARTLGRGLLLLALMLRQLPLAAQSQLTCPGAASACTPAGAPAANAGFNMGIFNVTLGAGLNHTTGGAAEGYKDYACTQLATVPVGTDVPISIQTSPAADENVRVWADLNNDGAFSPVTELVFSSDAKRRHTGSIRLPVSTSTGPRLRLRVAADYVNAPVPTPCSTPQYSQTEDYGLVATASAVPPLADFTAAATRTCTGQVQFTDQTQNGATSWLWSFGDGTTSTQQNPSHRYPTPGIYTVALTATNEVGSHTTTKPAYIRYDTAVPVAAACTPTTSAYCCNYGITRLGLGTFSQVSGGGELGYEDFTCTSQLNLIQGNRYPVSLTTGPGNPQDTRIWLDVNGDGTFGAEELVFQALNTSNPTGTLTVPAGAVRNRPLRLRVASDYVGSPFTACQGLRYGQAEDYTVVVQENTSAPVAAFSSDYSAGTCQTTVQFTDQSQNLPTSWRWDFGDGTTSTLPNPGHTYAATGTYSVSLTVTNGFGTHTTTQPNYVAVAVPCVRYCTASASNSAFWITNVSLTTPDAPLFTNTSAADPNGYGNFIGQVMTLRLGRVSVLTVTTNANLQRVTNAWIDWNRDGVFSLNELLVSSTGSNPATATIQVPSSADVVGFTRLRVLVRLNNNVANPCTGPAPLLNAEFEDYTVQIAPVTATAEARGLPALGVFPNPTADGQLHLRLPDPRAADTYALEVVDARGACVHRGQVRLGPTTEATLDLGHLPRGLYVLTLQGSRGPRATRRFQRD